MAKAYTYNYSLTPYENLKLIDDLIAENQNNSVYGQEQAPQAGPIQDVASLAGNATGVYAGDSLLGGGGAAAASAAPMSTSSLAATPAANAAWNAGATQAGGGLGGGAGMGAAVAVPAAVIAGVAINSMRTLDKRKKEGTLSNDQINKIWDPVGSYIYKKVPFLKKFDLGRKVQNRLWGDNKYATEWKRADSLRQNGINWQWNSDKPKKGRSIDELIANAEASGGNVDFAKTRDESKLRPEDTAGYAIWGEKYGNDYANAGLQKQLAVNKLALDAKALNEAKGTINANKNFNSELDKLIRETLQKPEEVKKK